MQFCAPFAGSANRSPLTVLSGLFASVAIALLLMVCGCGKPSETSASQGSTDTESVARKSSSPSQASSGKPRVVCSTGMIADVTRSLAGDKAEVIQLMGSGVDPHLYKATRDDLITLGGADLILLNGLHLEGKLGEVISKLTKQGKAVVELGENLPGYTLIEGDPHLWMDIRAWTAVARVIQKELNGILTARGLSPTDPEPAFFAQAAALDAWATTSIQSIPEKQRVLITAHDAFSYFGRAYGLDVRGIQGISTESEAGIKDIQALVEFISKFQIPAVFVESSVSQKNIVALVEGCHSKGHKVKIGGELFSDAMGADGTREGTYLGMIEHNVRMIAQALGGTVPASPLETPPPASGQ